MGLFRKNRLPFQVGIDMTEKYFQTYLKRCHESADHLICWITHSPFKATNVGSVESTAERILFL